MDSSRLQRRLASARHAPAAGAAGSAAHVIATSCSDASAAAGCNAAAVKRIWRWGYRGFLGEVCGKHGIEEQLAMCVTLLQAKEEFPERCASCVT